MKEDMKMGNKNNGYTCVGLVSMGITGREPSPSVNEYMLDLRGRWVLLKFDPWNDLYQGGKLILDEHNNVVQLPAQDSWNWRREWFDIVKSYNEQGEEDF